MSKRTTDEITKKQRAVLEAIQRYIAQNRISPTFQEVRDAFKGKGEYAVQTHIQALIRKGWLRRRPGIARGIEVIKSMDENNHKIIHLPYPVSKGAPALALPELEKARITPMEKREMLKKMISAVTMASVMLGSASRTMKTIEEQLKQLIEKL